MIKLINADCLPAMKAMPDKAYELAIVDPPYGLGLKTVSRPSNRNTNSQQRFFVDMMSKQWDNESPSLKYFDELRRVSENQLIFGGNYFPLPPCRCFIVWEKMTYPPTMSQVEYVWTSFDSPARIVKINSNQNNRTHPTQKPVALYKWLLTKYAKPGDKILDTHGGSMSIAIACHDLDFDLILYEIDKDYFQAGKERLERHMAQSNLFMGQNELIVEAM